MIPACDRWTDRRMDFTMASTVLSIALYADASKIADNNRYFDHDYDSTHVLNHTAQQQ